jgi:DNA (cytosine-5)-methyltransferase 1
MTVGGLLYQPQQLEPLTSEKDGFSWPTPTVCGNYQNKGNMIGLATAVKMWPTPRAIEYKDCGPVGSKSQIHMEKRDYLCAKAKEQSNPTGMLSPMWVEWLMGYQIGHTELNAWATAWFRSKSEKRSKS